MVGCIDSREPQHEGIVNLHHMCVFMSDVQCNDCCGTIHQLEERPISISEGSCFHTSKVMQSQHYLGDITSVATSSRHASGLVKGQFGVPRVSRGISTPLASRTVGTGGNGMATRVATGVLIPKDPVLLAVHVD